MIFGIANSVKGSVKQCTPDLLAQAMDAEVTIGTCAEIEDALERVKRGEMSREDFETFKGEHKKRLPIITPHAMFPKGRRCNDDAVASGLSMYDIDHISDPRGYYQMMVADRVTELGIVMAHVTPSLEGLRLIFVMPQGMTLEDAQRWMSQQLGDANYDGCVKDMARSSFVVPRSYVLYMDEEEMFSPSPAKEQLQTGSSPLSKSFCPSGNEGTGGELAGSESFKGIPYSEIIAEYWKRTGGEPEMGERNVKLHRLAVNLRTICDNSREVLMQVMPRYGLSETEMRQIVESACKEQPKGMAKIIETIIASLPQPLRKKGSSSRDDYNNNSATESLPPLPKKLPKLIKLLTRNTPEQYKAAVAHAVFPPLATHLCDVRFRYTDNKEHEATLMNCLMAGTGTGKSCIDEPIKYIMEDIRLRDKENERREEEWKKECQRKGANKDKRDRPEGLVIQMIDPDMTKPALVMRMQEAEGHFVYVKLNELDLFEQLKGQTGKQHFQLMCLAFDTGAEYGQTRVGTQSVTARPMCRFNWNACTTILKGRRFFSKVLTDGPISRINFCTIPEEEIGAEQPVFGLYDAAFEEELKQYIDRLCAARGLISCPQAFTLAKKLQRECADFARLSQNETYWNLSHRACVIAWLKACVLYVANGNKWERSIEDFIRWSLEYDLWCKMQFFGNAIEKANSGEGARIGTRGPRNLLELLPQTFTLDDAKRMRRQQGLDTENYRTEKMIRTWVNRKYVIQNTEYSFQKSNNYGTTE